MNNTGINPLAGAGSTLTPGTVHALLLCISASIRASSSELLYRITKLSFTKQKQSLATSVVRAAVSGRLGGHVGEINALTEHVT